MTTKFNPLAKKGFDKIGMSEAEVSAAHLKLDQTTPQTITGGIPLLTSLTPTTDYMIATKKYVDENAGGVTDHGALTGLTDDDHTQYIYNAPALSTRNVITAANATTVPLGLKGAASQSANLFEIENSLGNDKFVVNQNGVISGGTYAYLSNRAVKLNLAYMNQANAAYAQFRFPRGGEFYVLEHDVLGTADIFFQGYPNDNKGNFILEGWTCNSFVVGTGGNANPVIFRVNRVDMGRITSTGWMIGSGVAGTDYTLTFNGETNDGILTWMEDEDYFKFNDDLFMLGGENIVLDTSTGTKIGTATSQLLGFWNATPVDQPATVNDAVTQDLTGTDTVDKTKLEADLTSCKNAINTIIDRLQEIGLVA